METAQQSLIRHVGRRQIGREDDQAIERHRELPARAQAQVVESALERDHPSVKNALRRDPLPPEIVDHKDAARRLEVSGRFVELSGRIEHEIEHLKGELAAHHRHRPAAGEPATVAHGRRSS